VVEGPVTVLDEGVKTLLQFLGSHLRVVLADDAENVIERHQALAGDHAGYLSKIHPGTRTATG
jgi:hypothetical protein